VIEKKNKHAGQISTPRQSSGWKVLVFPQISIGADPASFQRYADLLERNPLHQGWIKAATAHEERIEAKQLDWLHVFSNTLYILIGSAVFRPTLWGITRLVRRVIVPRQ
jgi:hypothetical protein